MKNEFNKSKPVLRELEKTLLLVQAEMILRGNENDEDNLYESKVNDVERKFNEIKNILSNMMSNIESLIEPSDTK